MNTGEEMKQKEVLMTWLEFSSGFTQNGVTNFSTVSLSHPNSELSLSPPNK